MLVNVVVYTLTEQILNKVVTKTLTTIKSIYTLVPIFCKTIEFFHYKVY